jgi:long-chain acyl-CoA synthetase
MKNIPLYNVRPIQDLKDMLESSNSLYGSKPAFLVKKPGSDAYQPVTYRQFKQDVDALGTALIELGLQGKRIALIGENRYEWAVTYLAVLNGTGIIVPLDKELPANEIENLLSRSRADAIVFSGGTRKHIDNVRKTNSAGIFICMDDFEGDEGVRSFQQLLDMGGTLLAKGDTRFISAKIDPEAMSILLFTSGTTDQAKAVMLNHRNISANLMAMCSMLNIEPKDIFLSVLPIHHTYECTCGFLCPIYRGATVAFCEGLRHIPKNLQESKATVMLGVPLIFETMYRRIWDQASKYPDKERKLKLGLRLSNVLKVFRIDIARKLFEPVHESFGGHLRLFISGAAGIDPLVAKGFRDLGIHFVQGYGLTECAPIVGLNRDVDFKDKAAGLPLPGLEVRIDSSSSGETGEIIVKGPSVMLGYYENTEATEKVMKNGWFHTGDMGVIDKDGFIHITGRKKNVIVTKNGKNIYPEEIETLLSRSLYIKESLVHGKESTSAEDIEVAAVIVPDREKIDEEFKDSPLTPEGIHTLILNEVKVVNKNLILYKHVKHIQLRDEEFAKTTTKKIKRYVEQTG